MGNISLGLGLIKNGLRTMLGRGSSTTNALENAVKPKSITKVYTDSRSGIETLTREFETTNSRNEKVMKLFKIENDVLPDGTKITRTHVWGKSSNGEYSLGFGGDEIDRVKTISRKPNGILGGGTVTINKKNRETFAMSASEENLVKEYNTKGQVGHKELDYDSHGYSVKSTQDMVHDQVPLSSSTVDMYENPIKHLDYKHTLSKKGVYNSYPVESNNYGNFKDKTTAVEAKNLEIKTAAEKLEAEKAALELAAKEAAEKLALSRPRINVAKVLNGLNVEELKVIEKPLENGAIKRYYFAPGNNKPVIKTFDQGLLHQEWIHNGKDDIIYLKQVGKDQPYIYLQNGDYKQVLTLGKEGEIINSQYFINNEKKFTNAKEILTNSEEKLVNNLERLRYQQITYPQYNQTHDNVRYLGYVKDPHYEKNLSYYEKYGINTKYDVKPPEEYRFVSGNDIDLKASKDGYRTYFEHELDSRFGYEATETARNTMNKILEEAKAKFVDLIGLVSPFKG